MQLFKSLLEKILGSYVKKYLKSHPNVKLIAVVGSVGKTSVKSATATVLAEKFTVRHSRGNLNTTLSAPLEILGVDGPKNAKSPLAWLKVFADARASIHTPDAPDIIIQECGIDRPGEMTAFASYLRPDITIITAVSPEHMEFFGDITTVAHEEFGLSDVSKLVIYNHDDIDPSFITLAGSTPTVSYGTKEGADCRLTATNVSSDGFVCSLSHLNNTSHQFTIPVLGTHQLRMVAGAAAVALESGMELADIITVLEQLKPIPGRMQPLSGVNGSLLIDDSYNSSPLAAASALQTLYSLPQAHKIAILGDMNELGNTTEVEHQALGQLCNPKQLTHLITIGPMARHHLAPAAKANGCTVTSFTTAPEAAELLSKLAVADTALLFKGSQGNIYLEEAIKPLLANPDDSHKLVRQSPEWLKKKQKFFNQQT